MINHANRFFKEIKRLEDALDKAHSHKWGEDAMEEDGISIFPLGSSKEFNPEDCFKRPDGLWESYPEMYGRKRRKFVFIWREHPNYCCAGQPCYTSADVTDFLCGSETEKILYQWDGFEFVWKWSDVIMPTRICWGMKSGQRYYELRLNGKTLFNTEVKKHFNTWVKEAMA